MSEKSYGDLEEIINKSPAIAFLWRNLDKWPVEFVTDNITQFGYDSSDFLSGKINFADIIHEEDLMRVAEEVANYCESGVGEFIQEYRILTKEGNPRWVDDKTWIRRDSNGVITHFQGIILDISDWKHLEEELKKSEENYRLISENADDLITVVNQKFRFEYANEEIHNRLMGYNKDDLIGKNALMLIHPDDQKTVMQVFRDLNNTGEGLVEGRIRQKNGQYVWTETKGTIFYDRNGQKKYLLITRDISERIRSRQKLKESEEKYRIAYEHETFYKDLFTHDINNIFQCILNTVELYSLEYPSSDVKLQNQELFNELANQITRGMNLIKNVRKFSEFHESEMVLSKVDLMEKIKNASENVKYSLMNKNVNISYDLMSNNSIIYANELLDDAIENILMNAILHNENKDIEILIKTSKIKKGDEIFNKIEFIDNGIGIPDHSKKLIFQRGFNEKKETTGMGLGLSLVRIILETYNAKIWVEDRKPGEFYKGSNFVILFPEVS